MQSKTEYSYCFPHFHRVNFPKHKSNHVTLKLKIWCWLLIIPK